MHNLILRIDGKKKLVKYCSKLYHLNFTLQMDRLFFPRFFLSTTELFPFIPH